MKKLDGMSLDNVRERIEELKRLFPEAVNEGHLDYDTLMFILGDEFDNEHEKYRFEWKGKLDSLRQAQKRSTATLRPDFEQSRDWDSTGNLYLEGDNLEVLKLLQQGYLRKVKMIYIDPPYNTGNDFVYEDNFADPIKQYKEVTGQGMRANPETAGRYHSKWLSMMYPRLKIAKTLLRDDGVIFISIDDNEQANLKKLCDEVFGEENFVVQVVWEKKYAPQNDAKYFSLNHEYLICYARNIDSFNRNLLPMTDQQQSRYRNLDNDPRGPWKGGDTLRNEPRDYAIFPLKTPSGREVLPPPGTSWRYTEEKFAEMITDNRIWFGADGNNVPSVKRFLSEIKQGIVPISLWYHKEVGHTQSATQFLTKFLDNQRLFDFPKPVDLVKRCLQIATDSDSIILDFFSGSATTAHAVMHLNAEDSGNRKYIMIQIPEPTDHNSEAFKAGFQSIADIGKERIRRAGDNIMAEWQKQQTGQLTLGEEQRTANPPDIGFRLFKLDSSNLKEWDDSYVSPEQAHSLFDRLENFLDIFKPDRRAVDVVYELFLKYGIALTEKLSTLEIQGKTFYVAGDDGYLFICVDKGLTVEIAEAIAAYEPGTVIFANASFATDNDLINTSMALKKHLIEVRWI